MMPSWSNRLRIHPWTALLVLVAVGVFGFLSGDSPAVAQGTLPAPTNGTAVSNTAGERTLVWDGGGNADSFRLVAVHSETFDYTNENAPDGAARTGTVTGLTGGADYLGIVVAPQATADGLATQYGVAELVAAQGVDSQCSADDYDRDEWGEYPGAPDDATPTWTLPPDNVAATDITLDHHVALQDAHVSGGCDWSSEIKNDFATDPDNLNPTTRSFNSSKGSRTPDQLTGIAERIIDTDDEKCDYATQHDAVKDEYDLTMTANEQATVTEWLSLCQVASESDASTDKAALVALYNATDGPNWANNRNWLSDRPIGEWSRVSTDGDGRVTGLWLDGNELSGSIPSELGNLTNLGVLSLSYNELSGSIPSELGNLANLGVLWLDVNQLSGSIPLELGNLANLYSLYLGDNELSGSIPLELGNLTNLGTLGLYRNQLSGSIPLELGNLANLKWLNLYDNELSGSIPLELGNLANLGTLSLSNNELSGSIPSELGNLDNLRALYLGGNQLSGSIPSELGNLDNLRTLNLADNQLSGPILLELGNLANLGTLWLSNNELSGSIPSELGNLANLQQLTLWGNQLSGSIPSELGNLDNLKWLDLSNNQLSGSIPSELGNLANLEELGLGGNQLNGSIPSELGNLANLEELGLGGNQLNGSIPSELGNLDNLRTLGLYGNQLSGPIPSELGNLANLRTLNLADNQLNGSIPSELGNLDNLRTLNLADNQLSGEIPPWLGNLTKLEWLRLDGNEFTGQISNGLSRLSNVTFLVLSGNQLTGQIPSWLGNMTSLERLGLSDNRLSGEIPTTLGNLPNLRLIRLGGNSLTGCIPDSLQPVADNDFNRLGLPVCQAEPTASLGPSTGEGPYSIVNNNLDYSYTISLTNAWDQEREGVYSRTFPWSQLRVTSQYIETGNNLKNFSETVRSGLRDEWWPNASLFDISSVEEVQLGDVPSYRMRYRVQESPQYCLVDVEEAIVISDALPGYPKGFRVRAWMCESQVRAHGSERGETLDSLRIVTIPSPYYQQFIFTNGVTVKATDGVDPAALRAGADIVVTMLSGRQDLARCMAQRGAALAIIPRDQPVTTLPEYAHLRGTYDFTGRSRDTFDLRGLGAAEPLHPVSSAGEEQLLGQFGPQHPYYPYRGWVAVHEFAHGIQNICFTAADDIRWREFYVAALNANLYPGTHMMADVKEFFAAFSTGYFEVTYELGPDSTRDSLKTRFPSVFESLDAIYGGATLPQEYREIIPR